MAEFEKGTFFFDKYATNISGQKGKYFIGITDGDFEDDIIVSLVINTEHNYKNYIVGCNKSKQKFLLTPQQFSFLDNYSSIMLYLPVKYTLKQVCDDKVDILVDKADDILCRQIKNCINMDLIEPIFSELIKIFYKNK